ncbi:MAG: phytanoyl-CoA dioxygenase family protein [Cyanobacteria bacterium REEB67]|nr:phytanoyl-CoA dioxygenase family protein [Cyanobacteria bacterium REEB67]
MVDNNDNKKIREKFAAQGFAVIPEVLTRAEVDGLRTFLRPLFDLPEEARYPGDSNKYLFDIYNRYRELHWLLFHERTSEILRSILGNDYVLIREAAAHLENFSGWHKDTTAQERAGFDFQWSPDYLMLEAAFYLQENDPIFGGGLDVEPGSHLLPDPFADAKTAPTFLDKLLRKPQRKADPGYGLEESSAIKNIHSIESKPGDLVIFDFRINHRATPRKDKSSQPKIEKMAIFTAFSRNNSHADKYHDFISHRESYRYLQNHQYNDDLKKLSQEKQVILK